MSKTVATSPEESADPRGELGAGRAALIVFIMVWTAWSGLLGWLRVTHPGLDHGDITTDANILNAGENFDREGFWRSWGVPVLDTLRGGTGTRDHYVTYPPGCYWLHQGLKVIGAKELWHFRGISVFWSSLAALLFFALCRRACGAMLPAAVAAIAYMLSRPFAEYADNLHYLSFSQVTLFATLLAWIGIEQAQTARARMRWLLIGAAVFAADSLVTFEHTLFIGLFGLLRIVFSRRWGLLVPLMALGLVPFIVLALRFAINAAALGSMMDVWLVMKAKLGQRTGATGAAEWPDLARAILDRLGWPGARSPAGSAIAAVRIGILSPAFLVPCAVLSMIALATWHIVGMGPARRAVGFAAAMLLGGATWYAAMREHALVHHYTVLLLLPGIAAAIGALVTFGWWQRRLQPPGAPVRTAGLVAGCVLLIAHLSQIRHAPVLNLRWNLDSTVHERNAEIGRFESRLAAARAAFAEVQRLHMYTHDAQLGRKLEVRFENDVGQVHTPLQAGEAQMVMWRDASDATLAMESAGPPRFVAEPVGHLAFFFPGRATTGASSVALVDGSRLSRLWIEPTLDGDGFVAGAVIEPAPGLDAAALALQVRTVDSNGAARRKFTVRPRERVSGSDRVVVWANIARDAELDELNCEVWFTRDGRGRLAILEDGLKLPEGGQFRRSSDPVKLIADVP